MTGRPFTLWRWRGVQSSADAKRRRLSGIIGREAEILRERTPSSPRVKPSLPVLKFMRDDPENSKF